MGRPPCCDKSNVKRGLWTPEEDAKILAYVSDHGTGNWTLVPKKAGLNRCGKSCRLRWTNYLRPDLKHDNFTPEEEELIIKLHKVIGNRWSLIAKQLPGRTDNDVKNYWNTKLKKKLCKMGIDPLTHKTYSQVLSECENIFANSRNHFVRNIHNNNMLVSSPNPSSVVLNDGYESPKNHNINPPWNYSPQFQLPPNQEIFQTQSIFSEANSSCSSPCSSTMTQLSSTMQPNQITTPSPPFSWSDFLLSDPISSDANEPCNQTVFSSSTKANSAEDVALMNNGSDQVMLNNTNADAFSSSGSSFVDAILCQDSAMSSELFELLDSSFD